jgi:hypothetical protein
MNRREFFRAAAPVVFVAAAPAILRLGLHMPVRTLAPAPALTIEEFAERFLDPAMKRLAAEMDLRLGDVISFGQAFFKTEGDGQLRHFTVTEVVKA